MLSRITITIPGDLVEAADGKAAELERSRSWIVVEALRAYLRDGAARPSVAHDRAPTYATGLGPLRQAQLEADLAHTPSQRVRIAEQTAREARVGWRRARRDQLIAFDRFEDFFEWEKREALGP